MGLVLVFSSCQIVLHPSVIAEKVSVSDAGDSVTAAVPGERELGAAAEQAVGAAT